MKTIRLFATLCTFVLLAGCNKELIVTKLPNKDDQIRLGIPYNLQYTKYKATITRGILSCVDNMNRPDVKPYVKVSLESETVDDGDHMYLIDPTSLIGTTQVSNLSVTLEGGRRLVSINAKSDDRTAETVASVVSGVAKIATSAILPTPRIAQPTQFVLTCSDIVAHAIQNITQLNKTIGKSTAIIAKLGEEITAYDLELAALDDSSSVDCIVDANLQHAKCKKERAVFALRAEKETLRKDQGKLSESIGKVRYEETVRWPNRSNKSETTKPFGVSSFHLEEWTQVLNEATGKIATNEEAVASGKRDAFGREFNVFLKLGKTGSYGVADLATYAGGENRQKINPTCTDEPEEKCATVSVSGVRYRVPANGYLIACRKQICDRDSENVIVEDTGDILQLGHIFYVPFNNGTFSNRELTMSFEHNGTLKTASVAQKKAAAETAGKLFDSFAEDLSAYRKAKAEADQPKTELQILEEQIKLLEAQKQLADIQLQLNPNESAKQLVDLKLNTQLAQAKKGYLDAINALQPDQTISQTEQEKAVMEAEASLILAEVVLLEAEIKLKQAEQALNEFGSAQPTN